MFSVEREIGPLKRSRPSDTHKTTRHYCENVLLIVMAVYGDPFPKNLAHASVVVTSSESLGALVGYLADVELSACCRITGQATVRSPPYCGHQHQRTSISPQRISR